MVDDFDIHDLQEMDDMKHSAHIDELESLLTIAKRERMEALKRAHHAETILRQLSDLIRQKFDGKQQRLLEMTRPWCSATIKNEERARGDEVW